MNCEEFGSLLNNVIYANFRCCHVFTSFVGAVSCHLQVTRMLPSLCRSNSVKKGSVIHDESRSSNCRIFL